MIASRPFAGMSLATFPKDSNGAALLVMLFLVLVAFSTIIVSQLSRANLEVQRQNKTLEVLAQAKQALIAWSVLNGDTGTNPLRRPGALPCPADPGNPGIQKATCAAGTGTAIGRLPWKTLGIDELRDAYGEPLWYSVSNVFRPAPPNYGAINSDRAGTLLLYAPDGETLLTPEGDEFAAAIFSPGPPLMNQDRNAAPNAAASYLDTGNGRNNANANGPFIAGPARNATGEVVVNDLVTGIRAAELIRAVENRVLEEAKIALASYVVLNGAYPHPAKQDDPDCASAITDVRNPPSCVQDSATCSGRLPDIPSPSTWFQPNGWGRSIAYAVHDEGIGCTAPLSVDGKAKQYVLIAPGTPRPGQVRTTASPNLANYLDDASNFDAWDPEFQFITPSATSNDQIRNSP